MSRNIYAEKNRWKWVLFVFALGIGAVTMWYTNNFVRKLREVERQKVRLWAEASGLLADVGDNDQYLGFVFQVIRDNKTVPVILTDGDGNINGWNNLDSTKVNRPGFLEEELAEMAEQRPPIEIEYIEGERVYIYYKDSLLLTQLQWYPLVILAVMTLFILIAYYAFSTSRRLEQNRVWAGMARETAHQIGTPLSSLMGWVEILRTQHVEEEMLGEMEKDIDRLNIITDRFSKIGSMPTIKPEDIVAVTENAMQYLKARSGRKINFAFQTPEIQGPVFVPLNVPLYEWVIENLIRNAIDAMSGQGDISVCVQEKGNQIHVEVADTGKGIKSTQWKTIFRPGFTTKKRGWGLGLSLARRIIVEYHGGKIFIVRSEKDKGTTFRVTLNK